MSIQSMLTSESEEHMTMSETALEMHSGIPICTRSRQVSPVSAIKTDEVTHIWTVLGGMHFLN